jgi:UPF0716 protein FxsA
MIFFLVLAFPILELYCTFLFIDKYSFLDFIMTLITSGIMGYWIMNIVGRDAMTQLQTGLMTGNSKMSKAAMHKGLIALGGLLFFIPGLLSDVIGLLVILPGTRHFFVWYLGRKFKNGISMQFGNMSNAGGFYSGKFGGFSMRTERPVERDVTSSGADQASHEVLEAQVVKISSVKKEDSE